MPPKWKEITPQTLLDAYAVHKCFLFTFQQMAHYPLSEFIKNVSKSDDAIFGNIGISDYVQCQEFKDRASGLSLYPSWLIADDLFAIIQMFYGLTDYAQTMKRKSRTPSTIAIRGYVVPHSIVSLYDHSRQFEIAIPSVEEYIDSKGVQYFQRREIEATKCTAAFIAKTIEDLHDELQDEEDLEIIVLFDRRQIFNKNTQIVYAFRCAKWIEFQELRTNHFIGFDVEIGGSKVDKDGVVRAYLNYGVRQRTRFYPEFMVSVVPKLFVRTSEVTEYERITKLYSAECKHGWNINLEDEDFNDIYKAITGFNHETNNYYRSPETIKKAKDHFLDSMERQYFGKHGDSGLTNLHLYLQQNAYDSDAMIHDVLSEDLPNDEPSNIGEFMRKDGRSVFEWDTVRDEVFRWEQSRCGSPFIQSFTECIRIQRLIINLRKFKNMNYCINDVTMKRFNLGELIRDFDHLVSVHKMFSGDDTIHIHEYVAEKVGCEGQEQCVVVHQFRTRRREIELKKPLLAFPECAVLADTLWSLHSFLLHRREELYRLSSESEQSESRYSSIVESGGRQQAQEEDEKNRTPLSIDFGESVLKWLPYGYEPTFKSLRDEMVDNKDSTVDQSTYDLMQIECSEKIKERTFSDYTLKEMLSFKFYTDFTKMCTKLRKAHWKSTPLEVRRRYYHWARTLYLAAIRHAKPIPNQNGVSGAKTLYHGLSELFQMNVESPTYYGPFSTTLSIHASDAFSKKKGLRIHIRSGYEDSMKRCLGIQMQSISCYKHEQELLLVDQPIPINGTKTWESNDDPLINHLLYSLQSHRTQIRDRNLFFKKLGIQYKSAWMDKITKHGLLYAKSYYKGQLVIWRLIHELKMVEVFYRSKYCSLTVDFNLRHQRGISTVLVRSWDETMLNPQKDRFRFESSIITQSGRVPHKNSNWFPFSNFINKRWEFFADPPTISWKNSQPITKITEITQQFEASVSIRSFNGEAIPIQTSDRVQKLHSDYNRLIRCDDESGLSIDCGVLTHHSLTMVSKDTIIVEQKGELHCACGDGVTVSFVAFDSIINNGSLLSGGDICIKTGKEMVNNGRIICDDDGVIVVWCTEFVNRGEITPIPMIQIMDNRVCGRYIDLSLKHIESDNVNFRADTVETNGIRMGLKVVDHREHYSDCHPRNLLVSGTGSEYWSGDKHGPPNEDWITFKQQTEPPLIATRIGIRNFYSARALKRISIECSVDGTEFEEWIEIKGIKQGKYKLQIFDVDLERIHYAMDKKWRFYKLRLLENYGQEYVNEFYEFIMFGIIH